MWPDDAVERIEEGFELDEADIARVERGLGIVMPEDLRRFYLEYNGVVLKDVVPACWDSLDVEAILPVSTSSSPGFAGGLTLQRAVEIDRSNAEFYDMSGYVPFATSSGQPTFYECVPSGEIVCHDPEDDLVLEAGSPPRLETKLRHMTDTLQEFLDCLHAGDSEYVRSLPPSGLFY